jgi:hypothetical protein
VWIPFVATSRRGVRRSSCRGSQQGWRRIREQFPELPPLRHRRPHTPNHKYRKRCVRSVLATGVRNRNAIAGDLDPGTGGYWEGEGRSCQEESMD